MVVCKICGEAQPPEAFYYWRARRRRDSTCKECRRAAGREYDRKRHGFNARPTTGLSLAERFMFYVKKGDACWEWQSTRSMGYGQIRINGKHRPAHAVSYELHKGPISPQHEIDHLCRNRACVNPSHLEAVSRAENQRRAQLSAEEHFSLRRER